MRLPALAATLYQLALSHKLGVDLRAVSDHVRHTISALEALGFRLASVSDIAIARTAATALVGDDIATEATLIRVQTLSGCACFVAVAADGRLVAMVSAIPLRLAALAELAAGRFDGIEPPDRLVARRAEPPFAFYIWGAAGLTWRGRRQALAGSVALRREAYPHLPMYARAATADGERVLQNRMGAQPIAGGMVYAPPWSQRKAA